ncbi:MAG: DNA repair exonuclease [Verrucomicrobiota bacterium]
MAVTFLHTADWQLGKPFASVRDEAKRHRIRQQRLDSVRALADLVRRTDAAFVLVAGDLFDSSQTDRATVSAACAAIGSLGVPVLVIPGNHDHCGPGTIWEQEFFQREQQQLAPNLRVILSPKPVVLENAVILPAPLLRRHEPGDPTAWIRELSHEIPADLPRIVLAHGTIQGFGSTQDEDGASISNWLDLSRLPIGEIDYLALGDWHGTHEVSAKAWYSGTHEIDRFPKGESNDPGHVLAITVARGAAPVVEKHRSSRLRWQQLEFRFSDDADLESLVKLLDERIPQADESLLLLSLGGSLGIAASARLDQILESWDARLLRLKLANRVTIAPTVEEIAALTLRAEDPLIATVARNLVAAMDGDSEDAAIARLALRELHAAVTATI